MFWELTPAETYAMMNRGVEKDKIQWEHTSNLIAALFAPHAKKGANLHPDRFNPYAQERMRERARIESDRLKEFTETEQFKQLNQKMKDRFSKPGMKTVWQQQKEKRDKKKNG